MALPELCLVTPALADANNGNWQTAKRWSRLLADHYRVRITNAWDASSPRADLLVALHARRSAPSIERFARAAPTRPLVVVLTGTDLYRDLATDASAQMSVQLADRLIVLHEKAVLDLPPEVRAKAVVCFQSCSARKRLAKAPNPLRALVVGHLREEKSPRTYFEAARRLAGHPDILLDHVGAPLEEALGQEAEVLAHCVPTYRWLGALSHEATRRRIQRAHVLVHPSRMEGGAHVVMEAVRSGTPVLASRISGNVGMLGADYGGYFDVGDSAALAAWLERCRAEPAILAHLAAQCALRAPLFEPARERATLLALLNELLEKSIDDC
ncbi:MAG: TIGR04348 family glycosyltransferase [Simplicispira suum]|uniref:selenoneine biosynthesis selenosugar synthase SenB n=1 Tax=Simplicispira suum TaxID=2109915 RepID=UPI001C6B8FDB|nr:selenoneine biosynthesis selenosugar synthase SenB [Simplicispira suum]MBW7831950.1 TIGR04348 family glycosyltransferase [Simplicispira suum]